jgi:diguanylate cyclase (GGDEF)-like protein
VRARVATPEYAIVASWVFAQLVIAAAVTMTGGPRSYAVWWLAIPVVTLPARFGTRGLIAGVVFTGSLLLAVTLAVPASDPGPTPYVAVYSLAALIAVSLLSTALMRSDLQHRTDAVIDGLTGMLNRRALAQRLAEISAQAEVSGLPVSVIAADLDHFKQINDEHGHAVGDAVLVDVAYRLRKELRAFDLAYRIGGEEFLVVLPGASVLDAARIAEQLRAVVAAEPIAGIDVTVSVGVAGSSGGPFDHEAVVAQADAALYEAKARGRDRVHVAGPRSSASSPARERPPVRPMRGAGGRSCAWLGGGDLGGRGLDRCGPVPRRGRLGACGLRAVRAPRPGAGPRRRVPLPAGPRRRPRRPSSATGGLGVRLGPGAGRRRDRASTGWAGAGACSTRAGAGAAACAATGPGGRGSGRSGGRAGRRAAAGGAGRARLRAGRGAARALAAYVASGFAVRRAALYVVVARLAVTVRRGAEARVAVRLAASVRFCALGSSSAPDRTGLGSTARPLLRGPRSAGAGPCCARCCRRGR